VNGPILEPIWRVLLGARAPRTLSVACALRVAVVVAGLYFGCVFVSMVIASLAAPLDPRPVINPILWCMMLEAGVAAVWMDRDWRKLSAAIEAGFRLAATAPVALAMWFTAPRLADFVAATALTALLFSLTLRLLASSFGRRWIAF
jgi:hypothetical protein